MLSNADPTDQSTGKLLDFGKVMDANNKRTRMQDTVAFKMDSVGNSWASQGVAGKIAEDHESAFMLVHFVSTSWLFVCAFYCYEAWKREERGGQMKKDKEAKENECEAKEETCVY